MTYRAMTSGVGALWRPRQVVATGYGAPQLTAAEMTAQNSLPGTENPGESSDKNKQLLLAGGLGILVVVAGVVFLKKGK